MGIFNPIKSVRTYLQRKSEEREFNRFYTTWDTALNKYTKTGFGSLEIDSSYDMGEADIILFGESHLNEDHEVRIANRVRSLKPTFFLLESYRDWPAVEVETIQGDPSSVVTCVPLEEYNNYNVATGSVRFNVPKSTANVVKVNKGDKADVPERRVSLTDYLLHWSGYLQKPKLAGTELGHIIRESDMLNTILNYVGESNKPVVVRVGVDHLPVLEESLKEYGVRVDPRNLVGTSYEEIIEDRRSGERRAYNELYWLNRAFEESKKREQVS